MQSVEHQQHIREYISRANCSECRADNERRFAHRTPFKYAHVREYLAYVRPRLEAIRTGENSVNARIWRRDFLLALNRRISSHATDNGRKHADSYLERLRGANWRGNTCNAAYFRQFAQRGASCLDY